MPSDSASRRRPRQARSRATVDAILTAAAEVFDAEGFEAGTISRIVERAGVSVGSVYQYFPDKDALLTALAERYWSRTQEQLAVFEGALAADPELDAGLTAWIDFLVDCHASHPRLRCLMFEDRPLPDALAGGQHALHRATVGALHTWLAGKVPAPELTAAMLWETVPGLVHRCLLHPRPGLPPEVAEREIRVLAHAYLAVAARDQSVPP